VLSACSSSPSLPSEVSARKWRLTEMLRPCVLVGRQDGDQDGGGSSSMGVHPDFVGTDPASRAPQRESKAYRGFRSRVDVSYDTSWVRLRRIGPIFCAEMRTLATIPPSHLTTGLDRRVCMQEERRARQRGGQAQADHFKSTAALAGSLRNIMD
jgi:hypothetical protein